MFRRGAHTIPLQQVETNDIGQYYASEKTLIPGIKCPDCRCTISLEQIAAETECRNCSKQIYLFLGSGDLQSSSNQRRDGNQDTLPQFRQHLMDKKNIVRSTRKIVKSLRNNDNVKDKTVETAELLLSTLEADQEVFEQLVEELEEGSQ